MVEKDLVSVMGLLRLKRILTLLALVFVHNMNHIIAYHFTIFHFLALRVKSVLNNFVDPFKK